MSRGHRPCALVVLDGFGYNPDSHGNAIAAAATPALDALFQKWPHGLLEASGEAVGLPAGQQGNSEVGHLTIGSGRVIYQPLTRISRAIADGSFYENSILVAALTQARDRKVAVHCLGMVSSGGVHSHTDHGIAVAELGRRLGVSGMRFHVITDGRDEPPRSAAGFVDDFEKRLRDVGSGVIATLSGRYWAMDRDNRWDRIERAYRTLCGEGPVTDLDPVAYIEQAYAAGTSDEFIEPVAFQHNAGIADGDLLIMWNFRPDRARQMAHAFSDGAAFNAFERGPSAPHPEVVGFTEYDRDLGIPIAFPRPDVRNTIAEVVSAAGLEQFHVAETEKYAHVTYFINGGREEAFTGEARLLVPSPKVATYDTTPAMSAQEITDAVLSRLGARDDALIVLNYANPDMVGHTGDFNATRTAVEIVDACVGCLCEAVLAKGGCALITADHGNAELKIDPEGHPLTAHTTNPVPVLVCGSGAAAIREGGGLKDVAPTVLELLGLGVPQEMEGQSLLEPAPVAAGSED